MDAVLDLFDVDWSDKDVNYIVDVFGKRFAQMKAETDSVIAQKDEVIAQQADLIKQLKQEVARLSGSPRAATPSEEESKGYNDENKRSYNTREFKGYPHEPSVTRPRPDPDTIPEFHTIKKCATIAFCPTCGDPLASTATTYDRESEDSASGQWVKTLWCIERRYCKTCKNLKTADCEGVLAGEHFGVVIMSQVYCMRCFVIPYEKIQKVIEMLYGRFIEISDIIHMCDTVADECEPIYEELAEAIKCCEMMWGDDTGWYHGKQKCWVWSFNTSHISLFHISYSRSKTVAEAILDGFDGIVIGDSHSSWNDVGEICQRCLLHYFRDMYRTLKQNPSAEFKTFFNRLHAILKSAINVWKKYAKKTADIPEHIIQKIQSRIERLASETYEDKDCQRYAKRLRREKDQLLTFLKHDGVPFHNNWSEQIVRIFAQMRKISYGNRSERGIKTTEIIMSVFATCKIRGVDPYRFMIEYLSGKLNTIPLPKSDSMIPCCVT